MQHSINLHSFEGFYESSLSHMIDREIESIFEIDDYGNSSIPEQFYFASVDYEAIHNKMAIDYLDSWIALFGDSTGIKLAYEYETIISPREYNFATDRLFFKLSTESVGALFAASEADNHNQLADAIKKRFTSYDGFFSSYSNDVQEWLLKPILTWDHNKLSTLLDAVLSIHLTEKQVDNIFNVYDLMESFNCNGGLSNAVCEAIPSEFLDFASLQREYGKALDYDVFLEHGIAFDPESNEPIPPLRCKQTLELFAR